MKHNLKISVSKVPQTGGVVTCRNVNVRERFLRLLFGRKQKVAFCMATSLTACGEKETVTVPDGTIVETESKNIIASGDCGENGDNVIWVLEKDWTLTISGEGRMADYDAHTSTPWDSYKATSSDYVQGRDGIKHVIIQDGVTYIGRGAFTSCYNITVDLGNTVTEIGMNAFANCGLKELTIPDSVTTIRRYAFENNNLTSLIIPDSVTLVEESAFSLNRELTDVTLGTGLKEIPDGMFKNSNLKTTIL